MPTMPMQSNPQGDAVNAFLKGFSDTFVPAYERQTERLAKKDDDMRRMKMLRDFEFETEDLRRGRLGQRRSEVMAQLMVNEAKDRDIQKWTEMAKQKEFQTLNEAAALEQAFPNSSIAKGYIKKKLEGESAIGRMEHEAGVREILKSYDFTKPMPAATPFSPNAGVGVKPMEIDPTKATSPNPIRQDIIAAAENDPSMAGALEEYYELFGKTAKSSTQAKAEKIGLESAEVGLAGEKQRQKLGDIQLEREQARNEILKKIKAGKATDEDINAFNNKYLTSYEKRRIDIEAKFLEANTAKILNDLKQSPLSQIPAEQKDREVKVLMGEVMNALGKSHRGVFGRFMAGSVDFDDLSDAEDAENFSAAINRAVKGAKDKGLDPLIVGNALHEKFMPLIEQATLNPGPNLIGPSTRESLGVTQQLLDHLISTGKYPEFGTK